jgi:hypothetical protein
MRTLIERLEAAAEGSPELDGMIWCVVNGKKYKDASEHTIYDQCQVFYTEPPKRTQRPANIERYTRSIDAALSLVPEGFRRMDIMIVENGPAYIAYNGPVYDCEAATPALALCVAALKARESDDGR